MKINCLYHDDTTASMHIYEDGHFYCYGCGAKGDKDKLPYIPKEPVRYNTHFKENLEEAVERILKLPKKKIRGLELPFDSSGYYIVYPNAPYYIKRIWDDKDPNRYRSPKGHSKPIMALRYGGHEDSKRGPLILVEGQINALSARESMGSEGPIRIIACPGAATDFNKPKVVNYCLSFDSVCIIVDKDAAGVAAAIQLKQTLDKPSAIYAMPIDLNEILTTNGTEAVKEEIKKALAMPGLRGA